MEIVARSPKEIPGAYSSYYVKLADHFLRQIGSHHFGVVLEAGCGKGQLTIPLLEKMPPRVRMLAADSSRKPYKGWLDKLRARLAKSILKNRVRVIEADVTRMPEVNRNSVDLIVSNELFCDLVPKARLDRALGEFWRVLRPGGVMVHGEWSSDSQIGARSLLVKHWPSWSPDQLHSALLHQGFGNVQVSYFETTVRFLYEAAMEELRGWGASENLLRAHMRALKREGFRLPFEHVIRCEKGPRGRESDSNWDG